MDRSTIVTRETTAGHHSGLTLEEPMDRALLKSDRGNEYRKP